jgi:hypothetical protein
VLLADIRDCKKLFVGASGEKGMNGVDHVSVAIQDDFLAQQTRAQPVAALAELIWNGLDSDASEINVELEYGDLAGGLSKIVVRDNGDGFPRSEAARLFGNLGGSWKRLTRRTKSQSRMIHGQEGRGRYKAFALGRSIAWKVCYVDAGQPKAFEITLLESDLKDVAITEERDASGQHKGVTIEITDIHRGFRGVESDEGLQDLAEIFALYLTNYKNVSIYVAGQRLDPETAIAAQHKLALPPIKEADGTEYEAELELIEWRTETKRTLYLCSEGGFPLEQVETRFHIPAFSFSAYLKSPYISALNNEGRLGLAEMVPALRGSIEAARESIKEHFRERAAQRARGLVEEWKREETYPFKGEPATPVERAERQVFDIVAVNVHEFASDLAAAAPKTRAFHLRMLRHAIERGPDDLQMILREVLDLPERKQKELAALLQETTLSAIITAAKTVADRLKFITALESIVFDPETKDRLRERSQLHKILAENPWVLGEEYNLWVSDKDLKRVLEKHRKYLAPDILIDDPVRVIGKRRGIVDLMLSRATRRHRVDDIEHLVVELKAPKVVIGADEITQTKRYAMAVSQDERFHTVKGVRWHFWIVSNCYDDFAKGDIEGGPDPARQLIHRKNNISVGIKTWGELIEENRARLQFFHEQLQHSVDESAAIRHLQERHSKYLEGVVEIEDQAANDVNNIEIGATAAAGG